MSSSSNDINQNMPVAAEAGDTHRGAKRPTAQREQTRQEGSTSGGGESGNGVSSAPSPSPPAKIAKLNPPVTAGETKTRTNSKIFQTGVQAQTSTAAAAAGTKEDTEDVVQPTREGSTTDSQRVEAEALSSVGLSVGDRLEVMWVLEEEEEKTIEKWWGCSVVGAVAGERDEDGRPVFTLHYDAYEQFEEADHDVTFTDAYRLNHLEDGAEMTWKKEGQEVDRDAVMASLADEDVDLQEVVAAHAEEDAEAGGESTESRGMKELAQLPYHQQSALVEGFRRMTDVVKGHLRKKMEQQGGGEVVVSAADVENMFREVRAGGPGVNGV